MKTKKIKKVKKVKKSKLKLDKSEKSAEKEGFFDLEPVYKDESIKQFSPLTEIH